jgi:hypothetical protein
MSITRSRGIFVFPSIRTIVKQSMLSSVCVEGDVYFYTHTSAACGSQDKIIQDNFSSRRTNNKALTFHSHSPRT